MENDLLALYTSRLTDAGGWCAAVDSIEKGVSVIAEKYQIEKNDIILSGRAAEMFKDTGLPGIDIGTIHQDERRAILAETKLGITTCDGLIAETGTAVLVNHPSEPREISLLPERHIVLATSGQLYANLDDCLKHIKAVYPAGKLPAITLISGPSRTSDIEKTLVIGVHGPKEFGVVVVNG